MSASTTNSESMEILQSKAQGQQSMGRRSFLAAALAFVIAGGPEPTQAQVRRRLRRKRIRRRALRRFRRRGDGIPERARQAVQNGEIRPLRDVMAAVRRRSGAEVLDVDLHQNRRRWIYALRVLTQEGRVRDVFFDARTLEVLHLGESVGEDGVPLPRQLEQPDGPPDAPAETPTPVLPPLPHRNPRWSDDD